MKNIVLIIIILMGCQCFGQGAEQQKKPFTYSVGLAYSQIWLQRYCYATDEYGVSSSPFNWGVTPYFSMSKGRLVLSAGLNCSSFTRKKDYFSEYDKPSYYIDKWQEASLAMAIGLRITDEHRWISVTPFLGFDLSYLINYEKIVNTYNATRHYNTHELGARYSDYYMTWMPFGVGLLGGIGISFPIAKHFEIGLTYNMKFKIKNDIRSDHNPHFPEYVTSPYYYHNVNIGISYRFNN